MQSGQSSKALDQSAKHIAKKMHFSVSSKRHIRGKRFAGDKYFLSLRVVLGQGETGCFASIIIDLGNQAQRNPQQTENLRHALHSDLIAL